MALQNRRAFIISFAKYTTLVFNVSRAIRPVITTKVHGFTMSVRGKLNQQPCPGTHAWARNGQRVSKVSVYGPPTFEASNLSLWSAGQIPAGQVLQNSVIKICKQKKLACTVCL
jgi:hypothetical protein